jgi:N-acyl-D-amino-acid deacylase
MPSTRFLALALAVALGQELPAQQRPFDVLIVGGRVLDGTGNPWFYADVGISAGRIVALGKLAGQPATRVIDAQGRIVSPGFIDIHSHADESAGGPRTLRADDPARRAAPNLVTQGITTVVVNQDGRSPWPIAQQKQALESKRTGVNAVLLVGHGEVRRRVMGSDFRRPATADEVQRMRALVKQALEEGASGMSAGLEYAPGRWSTTDEVAALVQEIVPFGGVYISHERSEGSDPMWYWPSQDPAGPPTLIDAVRETIEIGERTGATVVASHLKAKGAHYWGSSAAAIQLIERARARGVQIYGDQYPYDTSGSDGSTVLIPDWVFGGGRGQGAANFAAALRDVIADPARNRNLRRDIAHEIQRRGGAEKVVVFDYPGREVIGKSLAELSQARRLDPVDMAIALQLEGYANREGGARVRGFSLAELDIEAYARQPWMATATDGGLALPADGPAVHARFYGTFPRKIRKYALDRGVIGLEHAVRSATALPAQILGFKDRGVIREGAAADIVVFDVDRIRDKSTFFEPHQYSEGIDFVFVNGELVVDAGKPTGAHPGKVLTLGPARRGARTTTDGSWN